MEETTSAQSVEDLGVNIPDKLFFRIGDVADLVGVKPYVLRYWETEFPTLSPEKSNTGQRVYKRGDFEALMMIKHLLYKERYSIEGARKRIRELRSQGEYRKFKEEQVLGTSEKKGTKEYKEMIRKFNKTVNEIQNLLRAPITELFRF